MHEARLGWQQKRDPDLVGAGARFIGAPWLASPEDPALVAANGVMFVVFVIGAVLQVRRLQPA